MLNPLQFATGEQELQLRKLGYAAILDAPLLRRLDGVSFLAVLDSVHGVRTPSTRYEHTVATAFLAALLAEQLQLSEEERDILVIANLLHDVGHAPFSHNSEPFLLEQRKLYHQGVTELLLRQTENRDGVVPLRDILGENFPQLTSAIVSLVNKKPTSSSVLYDLFTSPLSCDKIEGNNRTLSHLGLSSVPPHQMLNCFAIANGCVCLRQSDLPLVERFWSIEQNVYWRHIYTVSVFSAEAMVTRALTRVFVTPDQVAHFISSTDAEAIDRCKVDPIAHELLERVQRREWLKPLSVTHPELVIRWRDEFARARFEADFRRELEKRIADSIGIDDQFTISHFSRRKYFDRTLEHLQGGLFDSSSEFVPLSAINAAFAAEKKSGDFFDIFYAE